MLVEVTDVLWRIATLQNDQSSKRWDPTSLPFVVVIAALNQSNKRLNARWVHVSFFVLSKQASEIREYQLSKDGN